MQVLHQTLVVLSCCKWMQWKDPEITNNETIHILTFRAHFQISLLFPSSGNHRMIHNKGGRIRTYGRPAPDPLGWVAGLAPLVASVLETDALRYPARNLVSSTLLPVVPLPIAGNLRSGRPWPNKNDYPYDQTRTSLKPRDGPAFT